MAMMEEKCSQMGRWDYRHAEEEKWDDKHDVAGKWDDKHFEAGRWDDQHAGMAKGNLVRWLWGLQCELVVCPL